METDNPIFTDSASARAYIRNLANKFEEPEEMLAFLNVCEIAQATLICLLLKENMYYRMVKNYYTQETLVKKECMVEIELQCNKYSKAFAEYGRAKEQLKIILSQLDMSIETGC